MVGCHTGPPNYCTYICWLSLRHFYKPDCQSQKANNAGRKPPVYIDEKIQDILASTMPLIIEFFIKICKILRTDRKINFKFTIKFLMTLERSYLGYLGFLVTVFFNSVLMYSKGAICLSRLLFKMGLFTVCDWRPVTLNPAVLTCL